MIQQDIQNGRGLMLLDPHGELYNHLANWLSENEPLLKRRKVRLLDLTSPEWSFSFNPLLARSDEHVPATVDAAVAGIAHTMGTSDLNETPLLRQALDAICTALAYSRQSLVQAHYFFDQRYYAERRPLIEAIPHRVHRQLWDKLEGMTARAYNETFASAERRVSQFTTDPMLAAILGQTNHTLDLLKTMDDGEILLVNMAVTGGRTVPGSVKLLGRLLVNNLVTRAYERNPIERPRPFTLYLDEAQNFLSSDVPEILSQCRKYGLHLVLAHQYLEQLRSAGDLIYRGVMGTARSKVVFSLDDPDDARIMSERIFAGRIDYEKPKRSMFKPVVVGHELIELASANQSRTGSQSRSETASRAAAHSDTHGRTSTEGWSHTDGTTETEGTAETVGRTDTVGTSHSDTTGETAGRSQTVGRTDTRGRNSVLTDTGSSSRTDGASSAHSTASSQGSGTAEEYSVVAEAGFVMPRELLHQGSIQEQNSSGSSQGTTRGKNSAVTSGSSHSHAIGTNSSTGISSSDTNSRSLSHSATDTVSQSVAHSQSSTRSRSLAQSSSDTVSGSNAFSHSTGRTDTQGRSDGRTEGMSATSGRGVSQSLKPIIEERPGQLYSLEEQKQAFTDAILLCPARTAFVAVPGRDSVLMKTLRVDDTVHSPTRLRRITNELNEQSPFHLPRADALERNKQADRKLRLTEQSEESVWE